MAAFGEHSSTFRSRSARMGGSCCESRRRLSDYWRSERDVSGRAASCAGSDGDSQPFQSWVFEVLMESAPDYRPGYPDAQYLEKGAQIVPSRPDLFEKPTSSSRSLCYGSNDVTGKDDLPLLRKDQILIGFLRPFGSREAVQEIADRGVTSFSVELCPGRHVPRAWMRSPPWAPSADTKRY